jgi:serine/threonine protein kinase
MSVLSPEKLPADLEDLLDGRYRIIQVLSSNPWGQSCLAEDIRRPSQPKCIVQQINPIPAETNYVDAVRHLFVREAAILEKLSEHEQIPQLLAYFEDGESFYLVQEFVNGYPLSVHLQPEQPWHPEQVMHLLMECLPPLAFVHSQGLWHGNLKPDNLLRRMRDERLVLINFDSVKQMHLSLLALHGSMEAVQPAVNQGYQAPEQLEGTTCPASDVYAIGMIGIQALTGVHPLLMHPSPETGEIQWQTYFPQAASESQAELVAILNRMTRRDREERYPTAIAALEALHQAFMRPLAAPPVTAEFALPIPLPPTPLVAEQQETGIVPVNPATEVELATVEENPPQVLHLQESEIDTRQSNGVALLVGTGIGAVLSATVCGYVTLVNPPVPAEQGNQVLQQATKKFQEGKLPQAISMAESIPNTSQTYPTAQASIAHWKKDWQKAATAYEAMVNASNQGNWLEVLRQQKNIPPIAYWQDQATSLAREATDNANVAAQQLFTQAQTQAEKHKFAEAVASLKQIPQGTSVYAQAQEALRNYAQKQEGQSKTLLQNAFDRAIVRDFSSALAYLKQIPESDPTYAKAQEKIQEYTLKETIQAKSWLVAAYQQAEAKDFVAALTSLQKIPAGTTVDATVKEKTKEYTEKLYIWSNYWLQKANEQADAGDYGNAVASLKKIPIGTPAYSEAREKIDLYTAKKQQQPQNLATAKPSSAVPSDEEMARFSYRPSSNTPPSPTRFVSNSSGLNPGNYLREAVPQ